MSGFRDRSKLLIRSQTEIKIIPVNRICALLSDGNYTTIVLANSDKLFVSKSLKQYHSLLEGKGFFRCHHRCIINLSRVDCYQTSTKTVLIQGRSYPVSRRKAKELVKNIYTNLDENQKVF